MKTQLFIDNLPRRAHYIVSVFFCCTIGKAGLRVIKKYKNQ